LEAEKMSISSEDYRLVGGAGERAAAAGLVNGNWQRVDVPRSTMKSLMQRSDMPAVRDTLIWIGLIVASGWAAAELRHTVWLVPLLFIYGALYGGSADSRWHEAGHGTAFRTRWMNEALYHVASFMIMRRPTVWRWSHARHHSDTLVTGRDPEIAVQRPPKLMNILLAAFALKFGATSLCQMVRNAFGAIDPEELSYIPSSDRPRVVWEARAWLALWPLLFIGLPTFYGAWLYVFFGLTQHAALPENVLDHRLNCRTIYMNRLFRFLYWNMNYHVEHHMFPMVPYHALPRLHEIVKSDCPPAYLSTWAAYREMIPAILRQRRDPSYYIERPLPAGRLRGGAS
jgi:fatty acid desaturase